MKAQSALEYLLAKKDRFLGLEALTWLSKFFLGCSASLYLVDFVVRYY